MKILLIRHGATDYLGKKITGRSSGVPLNEAGIAEANRLIDTLGNITVDAIFSSPMQRAVDTARPLADHLRLPIHINEAFNEMDFGDWTNKDLDELRNDPVFQHFNTFRSGTRIPNGESMAEAQLRIINGIDWVRANHSEKTVAIFSHGDMIRAAVAYYAGIHLDLMHKIEVDTASVSIIGLFKEVAIIKTLNYKPLL